MSNESNINKTPIGLKVAFAVILIIMFVLLYFYSEHEKKENVSFYRDGVIEQKSFTSPYEVKDSSSLMMAGDMMIPVGGGSHTEPARYYFHIDGLKLQVPVEVHEKYEVGDHVWVRFDKDSNLRGIELLKDLSKPTPTAEVTVK